MIQTPVKGGEVKSSMNNYLMYKGWFSHTNCKNGSSTCLKWQWEGRYAVLYTQASVVCFLIYLQLSSVRKLKVCFIFVTTLNQSKHVLFAPLQEDRILVFDIFCDFYILTLYSI